jgi:hypothetical protein
MCGSSGRQSAVARNAYSWRCERPIATAGSERPQFARVRDGCPFDVQVAPPSEEV